MKEITEGKERFSFKTFYLTDMFKAYIPVAEEIFGDFQVETGNEKPISLHLDENMEEESYSIEATPEKITVTCSDPKGAYYGLVSLAQLADLNGGEMVSFKAFDRPDVKFRAFSDDISRGQISTVENFKEIIKRISYYKYNTYMPYIEDTIEIPGMPDFGKYSDPVPVKEWQEICAYARSYNVSVRPIVNLLGHWDKQCVLHDFQKYMLRKTDKHGKEIITSVLDPRKPGIRKLILNILDTVIEAFGTGLIHVGGDEPFALKDVLGIEEATRLYLEHFNWLSSELKKRGCQMMIYMDMFSSIWGENQASFTELEKLDRDTQLVYWNYSVLNPYPDMDKLCGSGYPFYVSPASRAYNRFYPVLRTTYDNCRLLASQAAGHGKGFILSSWNDAGTLLREENMISVVVGSEFAWSNTSSRTMENLTEYYLKLYFGLKNPNVKAFLNLYDFEKRSGEKDPNEYSEISSVIFGEFWRDARHPVSKRYDISKFCQQIYSSVSDSYEEISEITPARNKITFDCFKFDVHCLVWACMKCFVCPDDAFESREQSRSIVDDLIPLLEEFKTFKREHKRLWMKTNRESEWNFVESRYIDYTDSLESLIRYCKYGKHLTAEKFITKRY